MKNQFQIQHKDLKCIWMSAGIVNYKLCDRDFECEDCSFDKVMRGIIPANNPSPQKMDSSDNFGEEQNDAIQQQINQYLYAMFSGCKIHLDRCYLTSHLWYQPDEGNTVLVGIDKLLLKLLAPIDRMVLPEVGETYLSSQLIALIVKNETTLPLRIQHNVEVTEINPVYHVGGINQIIANDDYLFKIKGNNLQREIKRMCGKMQGLHNYYQKIAIIKKYLRQSFRSTTPADMGITLADGGSSQIGLEKVMGEEFFNQLLKDLF